MNLLALDAARRHLPMPKVAESYGCSLRNLKRFLGVADPKPETVQRLTVALGHDKVVARALLGTLHERDVEAASRQVFSLIASLALDGHPFPRIPPAVRREAVTQFILARAGLIEEHPILAVDRVLVANALPSVIEKAATWRISLPGRVLDCLASLQQVGAIEYDWVVEIRALGVLCDYVSGELADDGIPTEDYHSASILSDAEVAAIAQARRINRKQ